jgi:hypothetical protein
MTHGRAHERRPRPGRLLGAVLVVAVVAVALVAGAGPAAAHSGMVTATDYRSTITRDVTIPGGRLRLIEAGGRVELTSPRVTVVVLGYEGEPYLRVGPRGVERNLRSPATYLNAGRTGGTAPPAGADADAPPRWERTSTSPTARWHDHRAHVMGAQSLQRRVTGWQIELVVDGLTRTVRGELRYVPGPATWPWLLVAAGIAAAIVLAGRRAFVPTLAALVVADAVRVAGLTFAVADGRLAQAIDVGIVDLVGWAIAAAAAIRLRGRHVDGVTAAGLTGLLLAIVGGLLDWGDLARSQLGVSTPPSLHRACIAIVAGAGAGLAAAAFRDVARGTVSPATTTRAR